MDSQSTESIKMVMTKKEAKAKVKGVMKHNGHVMKTVVDTVVQHLMTPEFGYIGEGEEQCMTQVMKDALENLIRVIIVKDHPKATAKTLVTPQVAMEHLSLQDFENLSLDESDKEIVQYLDTLPQDVWTVVISGSLSKDNNVSMPAHTNICLWKRFNTSSNWIFANHGYCDITILDSSPPQSSQQGDVLSSPPLATQLMNEEPEGNQSMGDYYARHTKCELVMSMDMGNSTKAKEATTSLCHMMIVFPTLSKKRAESMLAPFAHVKALKPQYDIGKQLLDSKHYYTSVLKEQIGELYDGTWLASKA
ncbi:hypothetical protein L210DRAFT_3507203 [Boletus edulis BED1]|uniref:Uncharacterized protein n=1 Tax=Boletus edulis BED1 TaxID=1328754 RepID=A0AAD4BKL9_BOLED|nr:hypothetical protein L210DRAFT_3507203 [Boletus edulis BED1]